MHLQMTSKQQSITARCSCPRCILLDGSCNGVRYPTRSGSEQVACRLEAGDSWGEMCLSPSDTPRRSHITLLAGNTGASYACIRVHDYDMLTRLDLDLPPQIARPAPTLVGHIDAQLQKPEWHFSRGTGPAAAHHHQLDHSLWPPLRAAVHRPCSAAHLLGSA